MEIKRKPWIKLLSSFLAFVIVITSMPLSSIAKEMQHIYNNDDFSTDEIYDIVNEVIDKRTEYSKVYELSNGSFYEITSSIPLHENKNGEWTEPEITIETPDTTADAIEYCDELKDNITTEEDNYGIAPMSLDINEAETSGTVAVEKRIICNDVNTVTNYLNQNTILVTKFPNISLKETSNTQVTVNCNVILNARCSKSVNVYAYDIAEAFNIDDSSLLTNNISTSSILDFAAVKSLSNYSFDITSSYMKWEKGLVDNNGIAFKANVSNNITINSCYVTRQYKIVELYDNDFTYHSIDMGRAGKVYINDYTNTVLLVRNELGIESNIAPVNLVRYFNFGHAESSYNASGNGAMWNYGSYLSMITSYNYKWQAMDGSCVYFVPDSSKNTGSNLKYWIDADDSGYSIELDTTKSNIFENAVLTTPENITYIFGAAGKVIQITDEYNNSIRVFYKSDDISQSNIYYIQDAQDRRYYFNYDNILDTTYEVLNNITVKSKGATGSYTEVKINDETVSVNYEYEVLQDGRVVLSKVTYPDNEYVTYSYDNGKLSEITDVDGRKLILDYKVQVSENETVDIYPCITSYTEKVKNIDDATITTDETSEDYNAYLLKSFLSIDNHNNYQRVFTNNKNEQEIIQYNNNLRISYYNSPKNTFFADYSRNPNGKEYLSQIVSPENNNNLLINCDFEDGNNAWTIGQGEIVNKSLTGNGERALKVSGTTDTRRYAYQEVEINANEGDIYVFGGWGEANTPIPTNDHLWGIEVHYYTENDEGEDIDNTLYSLKFDSTIDSEPQYKLAAFVIPEDIEYIEIQLVYSHQDGFAYFDEIQLYKTTEEEVTFLSDDLSDTQLSDDTDDTDENINTQTIYNSNGLITAEIVNDGTLSMISKYAYDENSYLESITDINNITNNYSYNSDNGVLSSMTIGNKTTNYSYTATGALREVSRVVSGLSDSASKISATYSYSHDRIVSITHNGIRYNLTYNSFGNVKKVDLENLLSSNNPNNLISYDYSKDFKQNLNSITYANGNILSYIYDDNSDNITEIYFKSSLDAEKKLLYKYEYSADGVLEKITDYDSCRITEYTDTGFSVSEFRTDEDENNNLQTTLLYSVSDVENSNSDTTTRTENLFGHPYTYTKNAAQVSNSGNETTYSSECELNTGGCELSINSSSVSDYFGRAKTSKVSIDTVNPQADEDDNIISLSRSINNTYTYKDYTTTYSENGSDINVAATTNLIDTFKSEIKSSVKYYTLDDNEDIIETTDEEIINSFLSSYEYDTSGRITHIYYGTNANDMSLTSYYEYDETGQMTLDANFLDNRVTKITYDSGGNITKKEIYSGENSYSVNEDNTITLIQPMDTVNYGYGANSNTILNGFSDLLTSVNNTAIIYDALGNPTNYVGENYNDGDNPYSYNFIWQGSLLKEAISTDGENKIEYTYNQDGLRTSKTVYSRKNNTWKLYSLIKYIWENDLLCGYQVTFYNTDGDEGTLQVKILYDEYESPIGLYYVSSEEDTNDDSLVYNQGEDVFWFVKDGQGNVIAMYNDNEKTLGCHYDASGNLVLDMNGTFMDEIAAQIKQAIQSDPRGGVLIALLLALVSAVALSTAITIDQTSYRGYIYDYETGLYYCQNRYYSPSWGRFISMDDPAQLTQNIEEPLNANLYAYCYNDPVNNIDPTGRSSYSLTGVGAQFELSACLLCFAGELGIELIYVWSKNALYAYYYYGGGAGNGYTRKAMDYLKSSFKDIAMSPKVSLKNIANLFKLNYSISVGFFTAFTNNSFSWPDSYCTGLTTSNSVSIGKYKGYKSTSSGCKTYGICFAPIGNSKFSFGKTTTKYNLIVLNVSAVKTYLSGQKNNIINSIN